MERSWATSRSTTAMSWIGLVLASASVALLLAVVGAQHPAAVQPLLLGTVLVAISLPVLAKQARREHSETFFWFLGAALVLKLVASIARYLVAFIVYQGLADASLYHQAGTQISESFRAGNFTTGLSTLTSTNFVKFLTGVVYTVTGPNIFCGFLVFSWLSFWGIFLCYRAFTIAVPEGRARSYARLVFFLPSMLFWPSAIGKEAWMVFAIGIAAFGAARILSGVTVRGLAITALGVWLGGVVRPHIMGMLAIALVGAYLLRRPRADLRQLAPIVKGFSLAILAVLAVILVIRTDRFLQQSGINTSAGASGILSGVTERTGGGSSSFSPTSILSSPLRAPIGIVSVLFRPFVTDAHNLQALATALEGTFLLLFSIVRIRWLGSAVKSIRRQPYVAFALLYSSLFVIGFSGVANFGLLARERVQLLPLYLVLFTIPRPAKKEEKAMDESEPPVWQWDQTRQVKREAATVAEQLAALQARTQALEKQLEKVRVVPTDDDAAATKVPLPSPSTDLPEQGRTVSPADREGPDQETEFSAQFTDLVRRTFGQQFEELRSKAEHQAEEIVRRARADAERLEQLASVEVDEARAEADQIRERARNDAQRVTAAVSGPSGVADQLRALIERIDASLDDLGETGGGPDSAHGGTSGSGDQELVVIQDALRLVPHDDGTDRE